MIINFSERLLEERTRLGMSQEELGAFGNVGKIAQYRYETGERVPDARYLCGVTSVGVDVQYLLTNVRAAMPDTALAPDERTLVAAYRKAPKVGKEFILQASGLAATVTVKHTAQAAPDLDLIAGCKPNRERKK